MQFKANVWGKYGEKILLIETLYNVICAPDWGESVGSLNILAPTIFLDLIQGFEFQGRRGKIRGK